MRRFLPLLVAVPLVLVAGVLLLRSEPEKQAPQHPAPKLAAPVPQQPPAPAPAPRRALAAAHMRGKVIDTAGSPRAGADVQAQAGGRIVATVRSDAAGAFRLDGLPEGEYVIVARLGAVASAPLGPIPLAPGEELGELELVLEAAGSITGVVIDAATRVPIEGASLSAEGASASSDRSGRFALVAVPPGMAVLRAEATGYEPREQALQIGAGPLAMEVALDRGARLRGTVLDAAGARAPGVSVRSVPYRLAPAAAPGAGLTDEKGSFEIGTPAGQVQVAALSPQGDTGRSEPINVAAGAVVEGIVVSLSPSASLAGMVVTPAGAPVPGAEVRVLQDGVPAGAATTDAAGTFQVGGLAEGTASAVALRGESRGVAGPVTLVQGDVARVTLVLGEGTVAGVVVDDRGKSIAGASVFAYPEGTPRTLAATSVSAANGAFELHGLPAGLLRVGAGAGGASGELRGVSAGSRDLRIVVSAGQLVGVVLRSGRPAADFQLAVSPLSAGQAGGRMARLLSPDGRFRLPLPPGRYEVRASAPGTTAATATAEVPARGNSADVRLDLVEGGVVEGRVLDARSGKPIAGARVSTQPGGATAMAVSEYPGLVMSMTGADGSFRLTGVPSGNAAVFASHPRYKWGRPPRVRVTAGASARADIRLAPGGEGEERFGGVGMSLQVKDGAVLAAGVVPGGPSWEAGVRRGDRVLAADGVDVSGMDLGKVIETIRGEVGTPVVLDLERGGTRFRSVVVRTELRY